MTRLIWAIACVVGLAVGAGWGANGPVANLLRRPDLVRTWSMGVSNGAAATLKPLAGGGIAVTVTKPGTEAWHVQFFQRELALVEGGAYTLKFRARSDAPRAYQCSVGIDVADWHNVSLVFSVPTSAEFKNFSFDFTAKGVIPAACRGPQFYVGLTVGTIELTDVELIGPTVAKATLPIPAGFFAFPMQYNETAAGNAMDVSFLNTGPADDRIVVRDGHLANERTGRRVRFFGTNLVGPQALPDQDDARMIARRLAKAGVNVVRLHGLDANWGGSVWDTAQPGHRFSAEQLDKLDYLVAQLKANGIYVDLNLKVGKVLTPADGFPASVAQIPFDFDKRVDFFDRRMIDLQKQYARDLLTHRNAYTKLTYREDPVVLCIEANNENSLVSLWEPTLGTNLDTLPEPFKGELGTLWSQWLKAKYADDAALTAAWLQGATPPGESILDPQVAWTPEEHAPAQLEFTPGAATGPRSAPSFLADVKSVDGIDWHVQTHLTGLTLEEGATYTVSFRAKADAPRKMSVVLNKDSADWHSMGLSATAEVGTDWRDFAFSFTAQNTAPEHARLGFMLGAQAGKLWVQDLRLAPGAKRAGLQPGESLAKLNLAVPVVQTPAQHADWIAFLVATERNYAIEMRHVVKDELKARGLFAVSQIDYGGITGMGRERDMDYTDAHAYWQHPEFPKTPWSPIDWRIGNSPEVNVLEAGELARLARLRVAGRPYSISEFDHPAPSDYVAEMMPTYATFAALQDWDAIYTFCVYDYSPVAAPDRIMGYFDQASHPAKWCLYPAAALVFRQGLIAPAPARTTLELPPNAWTTHEFTVDAWRALTPAGFSALAQQLAVRNEPLPVGSPAKLVASGTPADQQVHLLAGNGGKVYTAAGPGAVAFVGFIGGTTLPVGAATLRTEAFGNNFAAVMAVATDGKPLAESGRILVTICGQVENQGMVWNKERTSVTNQWGQGPTIAQHVPAQLTLPARGPRQAYALDSTGRRMKEVPLAAAGGTITLTSRLEDATIVYEITAE